MIAAKRLMLRFFVQNEASNLVKVYPITAFNASNPDASTVSATAIASCPIFGSGVYECDVSAYVKTLSDGETAAFLIKTERNVGILSHFLITL
jgi:hypothetical protein